MLPSCFQVVSNGAGRLSSDTESRRQRYYKLPISIGNDPSSSFPQSTICPSTSLPSAALPSTPLRVFDRVFNRIFDNPESAITRVLRRPGRCKLGTYSHVSIRQAEDRLYLQGERAWFLGSNPVQVLPGAGKWHRVYLFRG